MASVMVLPRAVIRLGPSPAASAAAAMDTCTLPCAWSMPMVWITINC